MRVPQNLPRTQLRPLQHHISELLPYHQPTLPLLEHLLALLYDIQLHPLPTLMRPRLTVYDLDR